MLAKLVENSRPLETPQDETSARLSFVERHEGEHHADGDDYKRPIQSHPPEISRPIPHPET
jgi:hypothetical protein